MNTLHTKILRLASDEDWMWKNKGWLYDAKFDRRILMLSDAIIERENELCKYFGEEYFTDLLIDRLAEDIRASWAIEGIRLDFHSIRSLIVDKLHINFSEGKRENNFLCDEDAAVTAALSMVNSTEKVTVTNICAIHGMLKTSSEMNFKWGNTRDCLVYVRNEDSITYVAPPPEIVGNLMSDFVSWWESSRRELSRPIGAALAHLYFVIIHPFENGNGRMSRLLAERYMVDEGRPETIYRPYSISSEIYGTREIYYETLQTASRYNNINEYIEYLLDRKYEALKNARARIFCLRELKEKLGTAWHNFSLEERAVLRFFSSPTLSSSFGDFGAYTKFCTSAKKVYDNLVAKGVVNNGKIQYDVVKHQFSDVEQSLSMNG